MAILHVGERECQSLRHRMVAALRDHGPLCLEDLEARVNDRLRSLGLTAFTLGAIWSQAEVLVEQRRAKKCGHDYSVN